MDLGGLKVVSTASLRVVAAGACIVISAVGCELAPCWAPLYRRASSVLLM